MATQQSRKRPALGSAASLIDDHDYTDTTGSIGGGGAWFGDSQTSGGRNTSASPSAVSTGSERKHGGSNASGRIRLDVGGIMYSTTVTTLALLEPSSTLARMFSPPISLVLEDDGSYFIDRNGTLFGYILDWLRDDRLPAAVTDSLTLIADLLNETRFYGLTKLAAALGTAHAVKEAAIKLAATVASASAGVPLSVAARSIFGTLRTDLTADETKQLAAAKHMLCGPTSSSVFGGAIGDSVITPVQVDQFITTLVMDLCHGSNRASNGDAIVSRLRDELMLSQQSLFAATSTTGGSGPTLQPETERALKCLLRIPYYGMDRVTIQAEYDYYGQLLVMTFICTPSA